MFNVKLHGSYWRLDTTVDELLAWGRNPVSANGRNENLMAEHLAGRDSRANWYGMNAAQMNALNQWPEGRALVEQCRAQLPPLPTPKSTKRVSAWREDGDEFCRDRFDAGLDEVWRTRVRAVRPGNTILKLTCEIGGACSKRADQLAWSGAVAIAACDAAEAAGYRVEIEAIDCDSQTFTDNNGSLKIIRVKAADEPVVIDRLCMALACPAFIRWFVTHSPVNFGAKLNVRGHFGSVTECPYEVRGDLHIGRVYDSWNAKWAAECLVRRLRQLSGEPEPEQPWTPPYKPVPYVPDATPSKPAPQVSKQKPAKPVREPAPLKKFN